MAYPPLVETGQVISAAHINSIRNALMKVPGPVDHQGNDVEGVGQLEATDIHVGTLTLGDALDWLTQIKNKPLVYADEHDFTLTAGNEFSTSLSSAGTKTLTLNSPFVWPKGVNGSNTEHYLLLSGGSGTAEVVLITGGSAVAGGTGTLQFTTANAHSGSFTIRSATAGIQEAIFAGQGKPVYVRDGLHKIYAQISAKVWPVAMGSGSTNICTCIFGAGINSTVLQVASTGFDDPFNWNGASSSGTTGGQVGLFKAAPYSSAASPQLSDLEASQRIGAMTIRFYQPSNSNPASLTRWSPVFYGRNSARQEFQDLLITEAWDGFDLSGSETGTAGGTSLWGVLMSAYNVGYRVSTALDSMRVIGCHFWPFGLVMDSLKLAAYKSNARHFVVGLATGQTSGNFYGRVDGLMVSSSLTLYGKALTVYGINALTNHVVEFSGCWLDAMYGDATASIEIQSGDVKFMNVTLGHDGEGPLMKVAGGRVGIHNPRIWVAGPHTSQSYYLIDCDFSESGAGVYNVVEIMGGHTSLGANTNPFIRAQAGSGKAGRLHLNGHKIQYPSAATITSPVINLPFMTGSVRALLTENHISDNVGGSGTLISIAVDDWHVVRNNIPLGWATSFPTAVLGLYEGAAGFYNLKAADKLTIAGGTPLKKHISVSIPWNPPSISAGGTATTTVSVPGATSNQIVCASLDSIGPFPVLLTAYVTDVDTVFVTLCNVSSGALDIVSGNLRVSCTGY